MTRARIALVAAAAALAVGVSACSSDGGGSTAATSAGNSPSTTAMQTGAPAQNLAAGSQFGPACAQVPTDASNPGSFDAMAKVPVATAASGNPILSTLVSAVQAAGLVDALNSAQHLTVFAPDNAAFAKIPKATLGKVLADKALLTKILTYHVVGEQLSPDKLSGTLTTLEKGTLKVDGTAPDVTVGPTGTEAHVVCGNIQTANATVYIIDSVMMPAS